MFAQVKFYLSFLFHSTCLYYLWNNYQLPNKNAFQHCVAPGIKICLSYKPVTQKSGKLV